MTNSIRIRTLVSFSLALAAACNAVPPAPAEAPASPAVAPAPALAPAPVPAPGEPLTLAQRLAREAASRPAGALRTEAVVAALSTAGVPLGAPRQVLARALGARYCAMSRTPAGLVVSVCEFGDDAEAARGAEDSRRTFDRLIPGRRLLRNRGTVLTLAAGAPDAARQRQADRAAAAFAAL